MNSIDKIGWSGLAAILVVAAMSPTMSTKIAIPAIIMAGNPVLIWWLCSDVSCAWMREQFQYRDLLSQSDVHQINVWWFAGREMAGYADVYSQVLCLYNSPSDIPSVSNASAASCLRSPLSKSIL